MLHIERRRRADARMRSNGINRGKNPVFGIWSASSLRRQPGESTRSIHSIPKINIWRSDLLVALYVVLAEGQMRGCAVRQRAED